jgi:hypothetical protein
MTPKERAQIIYDRMCKALEDIDCHHSLDPYAKKCALIAIDEIIQSSYAIVGFLEADDIKSTEIEDHYLQAKRESYKLLNKIK